MYKCFGFVTLLENYNWDVKFLNRAKYRLSRIHVNRCEQRFLPKSTSIMSHYKPKNLTVRSILHDAMHEALEPNFTPVTGALCPNNQKKNLIINYTVYAKVF